MSRHVSNGSTFSGWTVHAGRDLSARHNTISSDDWGLKMSTRVLPGFRLIVPSTVDEAVEVKREYRDNARIIAGGTDVLVEMKTASSRPETLIKIGRLLELDFMTYEIDEGLTMGALISIRAIEKSALLKQHFQLMVDAARMFANVQILNVGTIGGNICNASPAGDFLPCLQAMNAEIELRSSHARRSVSLVDFFTGPRKSQIKSDEIAVAIKAPPMLPEYGSAFVRFTRTAEDLAKVSAAVVLTTSKKRFQDVRISLGSVAPTPIRVFESEAYLEGREVGEETIKAAAEIARSAISPITDLRSTKAYRTDITGVAVRRAIELALERRGYVE